MLPAMLCRGAAFALLWAFLIGAGPVAAEPRPNVLLVIADDLGFGDIAATGGEVPTPALDRLARDGVLFSNFHTAATCSPSRAMLLTGVDHHRTGLGSMAEFLTDAQRGQPGYEGYLNDRVATIGELLHGAGYATAFAGKWHLGRVPGRLPGDRGFEQTLGLVQGAADSWSELGPAPIEPLANFTRGGKIVPRPDDRFSSTLYTDEILDFLEQTAGGDRPFLAVLSFQAVHWPHHAPDDWLARFAGRYSEGWDVARQRRHQRLIELGLLPPGAPARARSDRVVAWDTLAADAREREAARMAAYAAMLAQMDHEIGRVLAALDASGRYADTLVAFVSDNGADASEPDLDPRARSWYAQRYPRLGMQPSGARGTYPSYGPQWAQLGSIHLRDFKGTAYEGGMRVPLLLSHPNGFAGGRRSDAFGYATDLVPTLLDAVGVEHPARQPGARLHAPSGRSALGVLRGTAERIHPANEPVGYELMKNSALFLGDHKLVKVGPPADRSHWRLFDLARDPSETNDLAAAQPDLLAQMRALYDAYEREFGVVPMPDDYDVWAQLLRATRESSDAE
jgi:arylsulfatase A-like enzyme